MQACIKKAATVPASAIASDLVELGQLSHAGLHLAIGVFDGVHLGHRAVISSAINSARADDAASGVLTFDPHPSHLFCPDKPTRMLIPIGQRIELLCQLGVDAVCCHPFNRDFASITAAAFLPYLKSFCKNLKAVYVGENFRFGKGRSGDVALLSKVGRELGISVYSAERIKMNAEPISSTRIREAVETGNIVEANALLGCHYSFSGEVVGGRKFGRTIGFPTLNLVWQPECMPRFGVYYVRIRLLGSRAAAWQPAIANYGLRPTVVKDSRQPLLECHTLVPTQMSEGDALEVEWLDFIRPERCFDGVEALRAAIECDKSTLMQRLGLG
jgi:riboflavin kinase/FMN adenylyltransferase